MSNNVQPGPTSSMTFNLNPLNKPITDGRREWSYGLCDCFGDCGTCCVSWFCPCITYGKVKHRHEYVRSGGQGSPDRGCCNADCMIHGIIASCGFGFAMQFLLRGEVRNEINIEGGALGDCCTAFCCTPCELTQESRELDLIIENKYGKS